MFVVMKSEEEAINCNNVVIKPTEMSVAEASSTFPGFRFSPTDEELIQYYLKKKLQGCNEAVEVIAEVDICRFEPWDLPAQSIISSDNEWFYFSPRGRKYPNGSQSKRATKSGYWKATGKERDIKSGPNIIGTKRTLVFHAGRAPRGQRTEWIMHEYTTTEKSQDEMVVCRLRRNSEFHLPLSQGDGRRTNTNEGESTPLNNGVIHSSDGRATMVADGNNNNNVSKECSSNSNTTTTATTSEQHFLGEDDFYADIMKDDIIELDDPSTMNAPISILQHGSEVTGNKHDKLRRKDSNEKIGAWRDGRGTFVRRLGFVFVFLVLVFLYVVVLRDLSSRRILK